VDIETTKEIRQLISKLDQEIGELVRSSPTAEDACEILTEVNYLKRDLAAVYDSLAMAMPQIMGSVQKLMLPDGTEIEQKSGYERRGWKHREIGSAVADRLTKLAVDLDTGEIKKSPREIALEMLDFCAPSYWRIKELNKIGIDADHYCEVGELRTSIIVRKPKN